MPIRRPLDVTSSMQDFQKESLRRLNRLSEACGGGWVPFSKFYLACGGLAVCDSFQWADFCMVCNHAGLFNIKKVRGRVAFVAPAVKYSTIRRAAKPKAEATRETVSPVGAVAGA
jgi:hypothetical protein